MPIDVSQVEAEVKFAFDRPVEEFKSELFNYDFSIIKATKAVSSHGVFLRNLKQEPTKTAKPNAKTLHSAVKKARRDKKPICVPKRDKKRKRKVAD